MLHHLENLGSKRCSFSWGMTTKLERCDAARWREVHGCHRGGPPGRWLNFQALIQGRVAAEMLTAHLLGKK